MSLKDIADRMGRGGLSKQALSLIENGQMRIPRARLAVIKRAYKLSAGEQAELERLYAFERLVEDTGEDREFGEAVLSVIDPESATSIYVVGGRVLSLTSPTLRAKAAEFLQREDNRLIFLYPRSEGFVPAHGSLWFPNTHRDMAQIRKTVQAFSTRDVTQQIQFYGIDVRSAGGDPLLLEALALCGPFTAMTITSPRPPHPAAGYMYIEGPRDRWVLLSAENARRAFETVMLIMERATDAAGVVREDIR